MKPEFRLVSKIIPRAYTAMESLIKTFDAGMYHIIDEIEMHGGSYALRKTLLVRFIDRFRKESGALVADAVRNNNKKSAFELSLRALENELGLRVWSLDHDGAHYYDNLRDRQQVLSNYYEGFLQSRLQETNSALIDSKDFENGVRVDCRRISYPKASGLAFNARYQDLDLGWMATSINPKSGLFRLFIFQTQRECLKELNICSSFVGAAMIDSFFNCNRYSVLPEYLPVSCIANCDSEFDSLLQASNQEEKYRKDFFSNLPTERKGIALKGALKTEMLYDLAKAVLTRTPSNVAKLPVCDSNLTRSTSIVPLL